MPTRWTSRKFLLTLSAQIAAVLVLLFPRRGTEIGEATQAVASLLVMLLTALGYVRAEASLDQQNRDNP